ncbi:MAG: hypothetical protein SNJ71_06400 [Bacteroidales bacterium]
MLIEPLLDVFTKELDKLCPIVCDGAIIDAGFAEVLRQPNTREENTHI